VARHDFTRCGRRYDAVFDLVGNRSLSDLRRVLAESGAITPVIDRTYPLREAAEAIRYLEREHARAKVVLTV
jgi:D-arabinose 1-dehydrogenase-like Zn-dependent alcohol dehydrogenase